LLYLDRDKESSAPPPVRAADAITDYFFASQESLARRMTALEDRGLAGHAPAGGALAATATEMAPGFGLR
jgi:hypothetical protein